MRNLKKVLALVVAFAMVMSMGAFSAFAATPTNATEFKDWADIQKLSPEAVQAADFVVQNGFFKGGTDEKLDPAGTFTFEQFAIVTARILYGQAAINAVAKTTDVLASELKATKGYEFTDVADLPAESRAAIYLLAIDGVIVGSSDKAERLVNPKNAVTPAQVLKMLLSIIGVDTSKLVGSAWDVLTDAAAAKAGFNVADYANKDGSIQRIGAVVAVLQAAKNAEKGSELANKLANTKWVDAVWKLVYGDNIVYIADLAVTEVYNSQHTTVIGYSYNASLISFNGNDGDVNKPYTAKLIDKDGKDNWSSPKYGSYVNVKIARPDGSSDTDNYKQDTDGKWYLIDASNSSRPFVYSGKALNSAYIGTAVKISAHDGGVEIVDTAGTTDWDRYNDGKAIRAHVLNANGTYKETRFFSVIKYLDLTVAWVNNGNSVTQGTIRTGAIPYAWNNDYKTYYAERDTSDSKTGTTGAYVAGHVTDRDVFRGLVIGTSIDNGSNRIEILGPDGNKFFLGNEGWQVGPDGYNASYGGTNTVIFGQLLNYGKGVADNESYRANYNTTSGSEFSYDGMASATSLIKIEKFASDVVFYKGSFSRDIYNGDSYSVIANGYQALYNNFNTLKNASAVRYFYDRNGNIAAVWIE